MNVIRRLITRLLSPYLTLLRIGAWACAILLMLMFIATRSWGALMLASIVLLLTWYGFSGAHGRKTAYLIPKPDKPVLYLSVLALTKAAQLGLLFLLLWPLLTLTLPVLPMAWPDHMFSALWHGDMASLLSLNYPQLRHELATLLGLAEHYGRLYVMAIPLLGIVWAGGRILAWRLGKLPLNLPYLAVDVFFWWGLLGSLYHVLHVLSRFLSQFFHLDITWSDLIFNAATLLEQLPQALNHTPAYVRPADEKLLIGGLLATIAAGYGSLLGVAFNRALRAAMKRLMRPVVSLYYRWRGKSQTATAPLSP